MPNVRAIEQIAAPPAEVFAWVSDHERFVRAPGTSTRILRAGADDPNGLGCVREVRVRPGLRFVEEVTAWQPSTGFAYRIIESTLPIRHEGSRLSFQEHEGGTEVEWSGVASLSLPVLGGLLEGPFMGTLERSFKTMLARAKQELERRDDIR